MGVDAWSPPAENVARPRARYALLSALVVPFLLLTVALVALFSDALGFIPGINSPGNTFIAVYTVLVSLSVAGGAAGLMVGLRRLGWTALACGVTTLLYCVILFVVLFYSGLLAGAIWVAAVLRPT
jgi:hypothetical protein